MEKRTLELYSSVLTSLIGAGVSVMINKMIGLFLICFGFSGLFYIHIKTHGHRYVFFYRIKEFLTDRNKSMDERLDDLWNLMQEKSELEEKLAEIEASKADTPSEIKLKADMIKDIKKEMASKDMKMFPKNWREMDEKMMEKERREAAI